MAAKDLRRSGQVPARECKARQLKGWLKHDDLALREGGGAAGLEVEKEAKKRSAGMKKR